MAELEERVEALERAVLLLAQHVGAVGWNYELQKQLDKVREPSYAKRDAERVRG